MDEIIVSIRQLWWQCFNLSLLAVLVIMGLRLVWLLFFARDKKPEAPAGPSAGTLGEIIRQHRKRCHMTQEFVAEQLGVSRQAVSKWESGAAEPSTSNLLALAKLFQVDAGEMLAGVKEAEQ